MPCGIKAGREAKAGIGIIARSDVSTMRAAYIAAALGLQYCCDEEIMKIEGHSWAGCRRVVILMALSGDGLVAEMKVFELMRYISAPRPHIRRE